MTERTTLPPRRQTNTFKLEWRNGAGQRYAFLVSVGLFEDGTPAEAFLESTKMATDTQALARDAAILFSIARQYGTPLQVMQEGVSRNEDGTPQSLLGALLDGIAKEMGIDWGKKTSPHLKVVLPEATPDVHHTDDMATITKTAPEVPQQEPAMYGEAGNPSIAQAFNFLPHDVSTMPGDPCWCGDHPGGACDGCNKLREPGTDNRMSLSLKDMPKVPGSLADTGPTENVKQWHGSKDKGTDK